MVQLSLSYLAIEQASDNSTVLLWTIIGIIFVGSVIAAFTRRK